MWLEEKLRTDSEIVWANGISARIGATFGFVIATVVSAAFIPQGCRMIAALITDQTTREHLTHWDRGGLLFYLVGNVIGISGAVFCVWMWRQIAVELLQSYAREEWHLFPGDQRAEFRRKPVFRKWTCKMFEPGTLTAVHLENQLWSGGGERLWSLWLESGEAGKRYVDRSGREAGLRKLAEDFATTFDVSVST